MRLFICGDTHGNTRFWTSYLLPNAARVRADHIVQVGDFGFWEHEPDGEDYLDDLDEAAAEHGLVIYALHGNHDNWSLVLSKYGHLRDEDGFVLVRGHIRYIPQGHRWTWDGVRMRSFGGAYSIDKQWRLDVERKRRTAAEIREHHRREAGRPDRAIPSFKNTVWFDDEQMTDEEFAQLMVDDAQPVDIVFSHDKPRQSNPMMDLKNIPACWPNQDRLQLAMAALRPRWWFHGHLHHLYQDTVFTGVEGSYSTVVGLSCDDQAAGSHWRPSDTWCLLDTHPDRPPSVVFPPDLRPSEGDKAR